MIGTPSAGPIADTNDTPAWKAFVEAYKKQPDAFPSPSLFAHGYYVNMKAALLALDEVGGDVSDGGAKLREALAKLDLRHADRQGLARQEPQRDRRHLPHRGRRRA